METRGRGRKSASRIRSRETRSANLSSQEGALTRGRAAAAAAAAAITQGNLPATNRSSPYDIAEILAAAPSVAASTTTQAPANPSDEPIATRRRSRRLSTPNFSGREPQHRGRRRGRRARDSTSPVDRVPTLNQNQGDSAFPSQPSSANHRSSGSREAVSLEAEASSRPRRVSRKRILEEGQEQAPASNSKQSKRASKRRRRDSTGSGTPVEFSENAMEQEDNANGENGSQDREGQNLPSRNVSGIQGLLRRLGAGLDELFPMTGSNSGRFRQILSVLRTSNDDVQRLDALTQLCDVLSIGTEESMVSFSVDSFVPPLVAILNSGASPELMLLAARALTHMMDALPSSASSIAQNGAAAPLCANLLSIEFMDLAEQSLSALEKMSVDYPQSIVRAGGFAAALSYIDFFQTGVKRVAVCLACNLCRNPPSDSIGMIVDVLPLMMNILDSDDQRMRQSIIQGFARLAESFRGNSERLETFCGAEYVLIDKIISLVCTSPSVTLTPASYSASLRLLSVLARGSAKLAGKELSSELLIGTLRDIFDSGRTLHAVDALQLTDALLPESSATHPFDEYFPKRRRRHNSSTLSAYSLVDATRREELKKNSEPLTVFGRILFGSLVRFCNASANSSLRRIVLLALVKFIELAPPLLLSELLLSAKGTARRKDSSSEPEENFASFVAGLLSENSSHQENLIGLCLVESSMKKLKTLKVPFFREGVMYELGRLASTLEKNSEDEVGGTQATGSKASKENKDVDAEAQDESRGLKKTAKNASTIIAEKAKSLVEEHSTQDDETDASCAVLNELDDVQKRLSKGTSDEELREALNQFFQILCDSGGVSNFELSQSKLVGTLVDIFASENMSDTTRSKRAIVFSEAIGSRPNQDHVISLIVSRVLGVLAAEENLPIFINESSNSHSTSMIAGLRQLNQPLKLRLRGEPNLESGDKLRHYSQHVVLIEPLATMGSVQDFLWDRVRPSGSTGGSGGGSRVILGSPDSSNEDEAAVDVDIEDEEGHESGDDEEGGQEADEEVFVAEGEVEIREDRDQDDEEDNMDDNVSGSGSEDEIVDDEDEDEDEMGNATSGFASADQLSRSLPPLDVDYDLLARAPTRRPVPPPNVGFRSFGSISGVPRSYAAAVTNEFRRSRGSGNEDDSTTSRCQSPPRKLSFKMNGCPVSYDTTILQAVLVSTSSRAGLVKARMWEEVHNLTYSLIRSENEDSEPKTDEQADDGTGKSRPARRSRRLRGSDPAGNPPKDGSEVESAAAKKASHAIPVAKSVAPVGNQDEVVPEPYVPGFKLASSIPSTTAPILKLLMYIYWIVQNSTVLHSSPLAKLSVDPNMSFLSQKLTAKLTRQLSDPLALCGGAIPNWCVALACEVPILLPFETRRILFHSTALGVARALNLLQERSDASSVNGSSSLTMGRSSSVIREGDSRIGRVQRQKVRVHRDKLLESAMRVLFMYGSHRTVLEVEYFDEVGTGLGPTLEFFTIVSRELQRTKHSLWRAQEPIQSVKTPEEKKLIIGKGKSKTKGKNKSVLHKYKSSSQAARGKKRGLSKRPASTKCPIVRASNAPVESKYVMPTGEGLYPSCAPTEPKALANTVELFQFVGRLVAKGLSDGRLLDLRLCTAFTKLLMAHARVLRELEDQGATGEFEPDDKAVLKHFPVDTMGMRMMELVDARLAKSLQTILGMVESGEGDTISSLFLSFTVPGHADIELVPNGRNKEVTIENAEDYVSKVVKYIVYTGVKQQAAAFIVGFGEILDAKSLLLFHENELENLMCGPSFEQWDKEYLVRATRCDHGYRHESAAVQYLLRAMSELDQKDQGRFLQFITGSPALPVGGLIGLHPRLIIVKRTTDDGRSPDECLPTVMTCTNYLKLPDYSSYEICKERLYYAIREGQGCFHLS